MGEKLEIRGGLLARNTALNSVGQVVPLLVGIATIPYIVRGLGAERFGVLSIAWVFLGYFSLFDLGLGRATTKFAAECLGRGQTDRLPGLVWTSLAYQLLFGVVGALVFGALTPVLVDKALKVPPSLIVETKLTLIILAASVPVVLATNALRGVLEAAQRFDLINYVKVPGNILVFLLPAVALLLHRGLPEIVILLLLARVAAALAYLSICFRIFPVLRRGFSHDPAILRPVLVYGGWVTISNILSPLLVYADRFVIGALLSMAAVAYYTAPLEIVSRLLIFPGSLVATLFPAFSSFDSWGASVRIGNLCARSLKFLMLGLGPVLLLIAAFAHEILQVWLGAVFAESSTVVLRILTVGVLVNALAFVPFNLLQALGRPDVTAKLHILEFPLYAVLVCFLVGRMGIAGAALAWTLRVTIDALLLFSSCLWLKIISPRALTGNGVVRSIVALAFLGVGMNVVCLTGQRFPFRVGCSAVMVFLFAVGSVYLVLEREELAYFETILDRVMGTLKKVICLR